MPMPACGPTPNANRQAGWWRLLAAACCSCGRCGVGRDEVGEGDDVVVVVAGLPVERAAAGDQPQAGVVEIAVHHIGRELVLRVLLDLRHPEDGGTAVLA